MADPRAPTEHIGSQRAHTQALHLMMQLGSRRAGGCLLRAHGRRAVPADTQGGLRALGGGRGALHATATAAGRARPEAPAGERDQLGAQVWALGGRLRCCWASTRRRITLR